MTSVDPVNHPKHYTSTGVQCPSCGHPIEVIDMIENRGYRIGNALKYLFRYKLKGRPQEDLRKAVWYIEREAEKHEPI